MQPLNVLHLELTEGRVWDEVVRDPTVLGPVDLALRHEPHEAVTVFGSGPLRTRGDAGQAWLVVVGRSPCWGGVIPDFLGPAGAGWDALGVDALVLHGHAPGDRPVGIGLLQRGTGLALRQLELADDPWAERPSDGEGGVGSEALRLAVLEAGLAAFPATSEVLLTGPAARHSRLGSLRLSPLHEPPTGEGQSTSLVSRGGFGSRLLQTHGVAAVAFGGERPGSTRTPARSGHDAAREAEHPPQPGLVPLREWLLCFNGRSVYTPTAAREELYEFCVARNLVTQLESKQQEPGGRIGCGPGCSLGCLDPGQVYRRHDEPVLAFGPQLGVFDLDAIDALSRFTRVLGLDQLEAAALLAWSMECLDSGWLDPDQLGVAAHPHWTVEDLDPVEDSLHNASLAGGICEALFLEGRIEHWPATDLRRAARHVGGPAAQAAVYLAAGDDGWQSPSPVWGPDFLVPLAMPVRNLLRDRYEYLPPGELGLRAARWFAAELALANFGICPDRRSWALERGLAEACELRAGHTRWEEHHRQLAARIEGRQTSLGLATRRTEDTLMRFLQQAQLNSAPDSDLDRWVARMRRDTQSACRAYVDQLRRGVHEGLGLEGA